MRRPQIRSKPALLSLALDQHLNWYALAAAAAGVGMLGSGELSAAEIIYTKAHRNIVPNSIVKLDLNHDGVTDFSFKDTFSATTVGSVGRLSVSPTGQKNQVWGHSAGSRAYASALFNGVRIGPKGQFLPGAGLMAATSFSGGPRRPGYESCTAPWANVSNRYLGLKFVIKGEVHFGWARLNVSCSPADRTVSALLTGYAYESVPNRPIVTGRKKGLEDMDNIQQSRTSVEKITRGPGTLSGLAQGSTGWRRKQQR